MSQGLIVLGYIFAGLFLLGAISSHSSNLAIGAAIWFVAVGLGVVAQAIEQQTAKIRKPPLPEDPPEVRPIK